MTGPVFDLRDKRICVTGGGGFLGSFVVEALERRACRYVTAIRRRDYDLTLAGGVERMYRELRPQVVFHLAAVVGGIEANRKNPGTFLYENAIMGLQVIEEARRNAVEKTIVTGTVCSYPSMTPVPFCEESLWDGYPEPTNAPYGIAKKTLLVQCQAYRKQFGMNAIYLLPVNLYGPRDNFDAETSHVIPAMIRRFIEARDSGVRSVPCWGDGSASREFLHVADAAEGLVLAAERYDGGDPVNLGSGEEIVIRQMAAMIASACGYQGEIAWDPARPNGQLRRRLDTSRAWERFGFRARTPLAEGLAGTIAWFREQRALVGTA